MQNLERKENGNSIVKRFFDLVSIGKAINYFPLQVLIKIL